MMIPARNLVIGYAHGGMVHEYFMRCMLEFQFYDQQHRKLLHSSIGAMGPEITDNRNRICTKFLSLPPSVEWLLMADTDIVFKAEWVYRLIDHKRDIMSGLYFGRPGTNGDLAPIWYERIPHSGDFDEVRIVSVITAETPQRLEACGMGFCLIHRKVLEAFPTEPDPFWRWFGRDLYQTNGVPTRISEDLTFCYRARKLGFEVYGDATVRLAHLKMTALDWDFFVRENGAAFGLQNEQLEHSMIQSSNGQKVHALRKNLASHPAVLQQGKLDSLGSKV